MSGSCKKGRRGARHLIPTPCFVCSRWTVDEDKWDINTDCIPLQCSLILGTADWRALRDKKSKKKKEKKNGSKRPDILCFLFINKVYSLVHLACLEPIKPPKRHKLPQRSKAVTHKPDTQDFLCFPCKFFLILDSVFAVPSLLFIDILVLFNYFIVINVSMIFPPCSSLSCIIPNLSDQCNRWS